MNDLSDMTDLSFTQTKRAMQSKPLTRINNAYTPWWVSVAKNNATPKVVIDRKRDGKRSDLAVFTSL